MGMLSIEGMNEISGVPIAILGSLGQTQTVSTQEITNALLSRGYTRASVAPVSPPISPVVTTTTPAMTRAEAIKKALDSTLATYGHSPRCSRLGGCSLTETRFFSITTRAAAMATGLLRAGSVATRTATITPFSPSVSPAISPAYRPPNWAGVPGLSPKLGGISGVLHDLGQLPGEISIVPPVLSPDFTQAQAQPDMTRWDWVAIISQAAQGVASTVQAYANARAQRERAGQTATLTADQVRIIVNEAIVRNPALDKKALEAAAAGAADLLPKKTPGWVIPVVIGSAVVVVMSMKGRGR